MTDFLTVLLIFMLVSAVAAIHMRSLLSAVIALGALGFASALSFLALGAPDVAIPQVLVDVVTLVILIRATLGRDVKTTSGLRDTPGIALSVVLLVLFGIFAIHAARNLPPLGHAGMHAEANKPVPLAPGADFDPAAPSHFYVEKGPEVTGSANTVTAVLLDFRGYDTLGEATVLFTALVGAVVLLRKRSRSIPSLSPGAGPPSSPGEGGASS